MSKLSTAAVVALCAMLSACESYYKIPTPPQTAKVRFQSTGARQAVMVTTFKSDNCDGGEIMGVTGGITNDPLGKVPSHVKESGNTLSIPGYNASIPTKPIERMIAADKPFVFSLYRIDVGVEILKTCTLSMSFMPQTGAQYEITYSEDATTCSASVARLEGTSTSLSRIREGSATKTAKQCPGVR